MRVDAVARSAANVALADGLKIDLARAARCNQPLGDSVESARCLRQLTACVHGALGIPAGCDLAVVERASAFATTDQFFERGDAQRFEHGRNAGRGRALGLHGEFGRTFHRGARRERLASRVPARPGDREEAERDDRSHRREEPLVEDREHAGRRCHERARGQQRAEDLVPAGDAAPRALNLVRCER